MPELPELEILKEELETHVLGRQVHALRVPPEKKGDCPVSQWKSAVEGATIVDVQRRGKMLLLQLDSGFTLTIHLMMVGQVMLSSLCDREAKDVGLVLNFGDDALTVGQVHLKFLHLVSTSELEKLPELYRLGIDPLSDEFNAAQLGAMVSGRRGKIKSFLLDQRLVAGIGNTYADEILFDARIAPARPASSLSQDELGRLYASMVSVLRRGLELGGSSEMAFVHLDGSKGTFQNQFRVKGRDGEPCFLCGTPIMRVSLGGRGTYFCPSCQT
jgi:formamidopyrimidine-DNA glycosylase